VLPESQRERLDVVLVSPRNPLNIGAAARAMANFGFQRLSVVAPFAPMWRLARSAVGAPELLLSAVESATLAEAIADCTLVVGTGTLTYRKPEQPVVALPDLAPLVARELSQGGRVALVFGSEKHGLTRDDLSWCHLFVEIPTDPRQPSMNLGQAVAVCLYELAVRAVPTPEAASVEPRTLIPSETSAAPSGRLELLAGVIEEAMRAADYSPRGMQPANRHDLRLLLRRLALSAHDTRRILGLFRRILWRMKRIGVMACFAALALALTAQEQPPAAPVPLAAPQGSATAFDAFENAGITEYELKQMLVGKALYLRGGYLDNTLSFDEHGKLDGHSPQGSYTLSAIQIDHVRLSKHKVELEGARYGLRFLSQLAYEDPSTALERVRITPKKKTVKISIEREQVVIPKKKNEPKSLKEKNKTAKQAIPATPGAPAATPTAAPQAERSADAKSEIFISPAHTARVLKDALDQIFAQGLDERMMADMPDFWKLYYQAVAEKADYRPKDPSILRQNTVDRKARLLTSFEPDSNEFAQEAGVAGMAQYHAVIGPDGKVGEVAVSRPIGFGLDESAVAAIRKAKFEPAIKDGKPVAVLLDLDVPFRIFSKRTNVHAPPEASDKPSEPQLPGPFSLPRP
jgi:tRNA/rRNA methyltransferase